MFKAFKKRKVVLPILQTEESHRQLMDVHTGRHPCIRSGTIPFISLAARWSVRSSGDFRRPPKVRRGKRQKPLKISQKSNETKTLIIFQWPNIQCSVIELLHGRYHSGLEGSLNIEHFRDKPLAVILLLSLLLLKMQKCADFRRILAWEFVFQIDAVIQEHNNLPLFETLDPNYSSETCPTQFHGRLTKENKSHFVPIELVKKMLRSPNFTQSCLPSRTISSPIFLLHLFIPFHVKHAYHNNILLCKKSYISLLLFLHSSPIFYRLYNKNLRSLDQNHSCTLV